MHKPLFEVADVIRHLADAEGSVSGLRLTNAQQRVLKHLSACRTAKLGGHVEACDACGHVRIAYNSCRNRHCPKCQATKRAEWLDAQCKDLLSVPYFHVVFTLPSELAPIALQNQRELYNLLFSTVADTLKTVAADSKHLGAKLGFIAVLHTWGQTLVHHPHIHCVIPGGGLSLDETRWIPCRTNFFLSVRVLSKLFRAKFLYALKKAYHAGRLQFHGDRKPIAHPRRFQRLCNTLRHKKWVVYAKPPWGGPTQVLKYLARYTHRVAIANHRITAVSPESVSFRYKDYAHGNRQRIMTLSTVEFLRRFLQHVLPEKFVRIRHGGFLANRSKKQKVALCRTLIAKHMNAPLHPQEVAPSSEVNEADDSRCPLCGGTLHRVEYFAPQSTWEYQFRASPLRDSS